MKIQRNEAEQRTTESAHESQSKRLIKIVISNITQNSYINNPTTDTHVIMLQSI